VLKGGGSLRYRGGPAVNRKNFVCEFARKP
jgi:hypothetical protein